jgi:hypothetical protein
VSYAPHQYRKGGMRVGDLLGCREHGEPGLVRDAFREQIAVAMRRYNSRAELRNWHR